MDSLLSFDPIHLLIALLAIGTLAIRVGGFILGSALSRFPVAEHFLQIIPGCLLVALVAASLFGQALALWLIALICGVLAAIRPNLLLVMGVGLSLSFLASRYGLA